MGFEHDARVSLWDAVRRIVLRIEPDGPRIAAQLVSGSPEARYVVARVDVEAARASYRAKGLLQHWCAQEQIDMRGDPVGDGRRVDVRAEWAGRTPDYEHSGLVGGGRRVERVLLSGADIDCLCDGLDSPVTSPATGQAPSLTAKAAGTLRRRLPPARPVVDWDAAEAAFLIQCETLGLPALDNEPGWRTQADVVRFLELHLDARCEDADTSTLKRHAKAMVDRARHHEASKRGDAEPR